MPQPSRNLPPVNFRRELAYPLGGPMDDRYIADDLKAAFAAGSLDLGPRPRSGHRALPVAVGEQAAWIDTQLAPLIHELWSVDIWTDESCEDPYADNKTALIVFSEVEELRRFLALAVPFDPTPGGLYDRASGCTFAPNTPEDRRWQYGLSPKAPQHYPEEDMGDSRDYYILPAVITFPRTDIPALVATLELARSELGASAGGRSHAASAGGGSQPGGGRQAASSVAAPTAASRRRNTVGRSSRQGWT
jgi:hypothetical protein